MEAAARASARALVARPCAPPDPALAAGAVAGVGVTSGRAYVYPHEELLGRDEEPVGRQLALHLLEARLTEILVDVGLDQFTDNCLLLSEGSGDFLLERLIVAAHLVDAATDVRER
jgi:hypothetical protein